MFPKPSKRAKKHRKAPRGQTEERRLMRRLYMGYVRPAYMAGVAAGQGRRGLPALCERCNSRLAIQVHHVAGREGKMLNNGEFFAALCFQCHEELHQHPERARADGWMTSRYSMAQLSKGGQDAFGEEAATGGDEGDEGIDDASEGLEGALFSGSDG